MNKFISLTETYKSVGQRKRKRKIDKFPATYADYTGKHFPDEEEDVEPAKYDFERNDLPHSHQHGDIDRNDSRYNTNFPDWVSNQMYPKGKNGDRKLSPDEVYASMYSGEDVDDDIESTDAHMRILSPDPQVTHFWSGLAKSLYTRIVNGTKDRETFEIDTDQAKHYGSIKSTELYEVLDQALASNLDISNSIWDFMEDKNKALYTKLRKSEGIGAKPTPIPDYELFKILKWHPEYNSRKNVQYKENAGKYKLKDIRKRIRMEYGADADSKLEELKQYINSKREWPAKG